MKRVNLSYQYIANLYCDEDEQQKQIINDVTKAGSIKMQVSSVEGKIIHVLLKMIKATKVVEIGSLGGYSASWIAKALPEDGMVYSIDKSANHIAIAQKNLANEFYQKRIKFLQGAALEVLEDIKDQAPFDAIFIDAHKESYPQYFKFAKSALRSGGIIIADNTFLFDLVFSDQPPAKNPRMWEAMREFNEQIAIDPTFDSVIIPTLEGLTLALKK